LIVLPKVGNMIPEMGNMPVNGNLLCGGLFGRTRRAVIALLYGRADTAFYTKQVLDAVSAGRGAVQRELRNLTDAGIITREARGRQVYYRANDQCPIFNELRSIVRKTFGAADVVQEPPDVVARRFRVPKDRLAEYCREHHISRLSLFGSVLRADFGPGSDVDVLVEFAPGHVPGFGIVYIENELSRLIGRKADLRTAGDLSRYFRDRVVHEARVEYVDARA
jgi:predicted nucleotidyltransferase/DNA-binding transcriptional ArsR family regulator